MDPQDKYVRTIDAIGQVRIPVQIRELLGLHPRGVIVFDIKGDKVELRAADEREANAYLARRSKAPEKS